MGLGELGRDAARKLRIMGFDVAGWSRSPKALDGLPSFSGEDGMKAFLARTDILVSLLPLAPETRGLINAELLSGLARDGRLGGPFLINAGRGGLQVEADILAALDAGTLKGATLDVFETEPLPSDSPLWLHPAVTVTPHNAAMSEPEATAGESLRTTLSNGKFHAQKAATGPTGCLSTIERSPLARGSTRP
jgi:glyoxylate/hydroxypyruvate reductase A